MKHYTDVQNTQHRHALAMKQAGASNVKISRHVAELVNQREAADPADRDANPYHCTCNNWGPRFIENSSDGCCAGCWKWSMDHHYDYETHGQAEWLTCDWLEGNTWGIHVDNLRKVIRDKQAGNDLGHARKQFT